MPVKTRAALRAAVKSLDATLQEQRIVWIEGLTLPQSVPLGPSAPAGVQLAR